MTSENTEPPEWLEILDEEATEFWEDMGYEKCVKLHGQIVGIRQFLFTAAIVVGMDDTGYSHRFCYHSALEALGALVNWVIEGGDEPSGYIKRKG